MMFYLGAQITSEEVVQSDKGSKEREKGGNVEPKIFTQKIRPVFSQLEGHRKTENMA